MEFSNNREGLFAHFGDLIPKANEQREAFEFAMAAVKGLLEDSDTVDTRVQSSSPRWKVNRMAVIDRNILRLATWEFFSPLDTPPKVVINEAVELAKRYGAEQTRSFVNGILQQICTDNDIKLVA